MWGALQMSNNNGRLRLKKVRPFSKKPALFHDYDALYNIQTILNVYLCPTSEFLGTAEA